MTPLRVLVTTDSFPPVCGGSGWSTWELVRGLHARGHDVHVLKVSAGDASGTTEETYEDCRVTVVSEEDFDPYGSPPRQPVRTTEDYLKEREKS